MFMDYCWCKRSLMSENKKRHFNLSLFSQSTGLECFPVSGVRLSWTSYECEIKSCVKEAASKTTSLWDPLLHFCASFGFQIKNFSILKLNNLKNIVNCPLLLLFALLLTLFWSLVVFFVLFPLLMNFVAPFCPTGIRPMLSNFTVRLCAVSVFFFNSNSLICDCLIKTNKLSNKWHKNVVWQLTFFLIVIKLKKHFSFFLKKKWNLLLIISWFTWLSIFALTVAVSSRSRLKPEI